MQVIKVLVYMTNRLKQEICDSFIGTDIRSDTTTEVIEEWMIKAMGMTVVLKRLNHTLLWINFRSMLNFRGCFNLLQIVTVLHCDDWISGRKS